MSEDKLRRPRGVRLNDLDRSVPWVIAHNGRRWETVGPLTGPAAASSAGLAPDAASAGDEVASIDAPERGGRHAAPPW